MISQAEVIDRELSRENEADSVIRWASGRAFAVALIPFSKSEALYLANEGYLFYRLAKIYDVDADQAMLTGFIACLGSGLSRSLLDIYSPTLRAATYAALTFAFGKAAKLYFESGCTASDEKLQEEFEANKTEENVPEERASV